MTMGVVRIGGGRKAGKQYSIIIHNAYCRPFFLLLCFESTVIAMEASIGGWMTTEAIPFHC
jgi:hypothetical protein